MVKPFVCAVTRIAVATSVLALMPAFASTLGYETAPGDVFSALATAPAVVRIHHEAGANWIPADGIAAEMPSEVLAPFPPYQALGPRGAFRLIRMTAGFEVEPTETNDAPELTSMLMIGAGLVLMGFMKTYADTKPPLN